MIDVGAEIIEMQIPFSEPMADGPVIMKAGDESLKGAEYLAACDKTGIAPIFLFTPTNTVERLKTLSKYGKGMAYCVGRTGVTGIKTKFDETMNALIKKYKSVTKLPIGVGFGIQSKSDVDALPPEVDIAIIGTKLLTIQKEQGIAAVGAFLKGLRE